MVPERSMIGRNSRYGGRQRNHDQDQDQMISITDPIPSIVNSNRSKPTISSLLFSTFSPPATSSDQPTTHKKKNFTSGTFRGLGCTASSQVSVPAVIRTSANWEAKNVKKKKQKEKKNKATDSTSVGLGGTTVGAPGNVHGVNNNGNNNPSTSFGLSSSCVAVPDVWCGPGIGLTTDAASVDYVVSRKPSGRGRVEGHRERPSCSMRRMVSPEDNPFMDYDTAVGIQHIRLDTFASRHHGSLQNQNSCPEGLAEIVMLQSNLLMGGRLESLDRYRDWRLDVDNMSYEELLELGDKIGHVSTGLREDEINCCLRNVKPSIKETLSLLLAEKERKCSICQEDFEADNEIGKLNCGHSYHVQCIKQWLLHKNACPVCKTMAKS